jgi:hypothetical protein
MSGGAFFVRPPPALNVEQVNLILNAGSTFKWFFAVPGGKFVFRVKNFIASVVVNTVVALPIYTQESKNRCRIRWFCPPRGCSLRLSSRGIDSLELTLVKRAISTFLGYSESQIAHWGILGRNTLNNQGFPLPTPLRDLD